MNVKYKTLLREVTRKIILEQFGPGTLGRKKRKLDGSLWEMFNPSDFLPAFRQVFISYDTIVP